MLLQIASKIPVQHPPTKASPENLEELKPMIAHARRRPAGSIWDMASQARLVVIGRVEKVLRKEHIPINSTNPQQHTVFSVKVEECLLDRCIYTQRKQATPTLMVKIMGGDLDWEIVNNVSSG